MNSATRIARRLRWVPDGSTRWFTASICLREGREKACGPSDGRKGRIEIHRHRAAEGFWGMGIRAAARHRVAQGPPRQARLRTLLVPRRGAATRAGGTEGIVPSRLVGVGATLRGRSARIPLAIAIGERLAETFLGACPVQGSGSRTPKMPKFARGVGRGHLLFAAESARVRPGLAAQVLTGANESRPSNRSIGLV